MNANGARAEQQAAGFLENAGLRIVERNWNCRMGEIDLIAEDGCVLVFVEVRLRRSRYFGGGLESVSTRKRRRLVAAARHYLTGRAERACRFDVVVLEDGQGDALRWVRDAF